MTKPKKDAKKTSKLNENAVNRAAALLVQTRNADGVARALAAEGVANAQEIVANAQERIALAAVADRREELVNALARYDRLYNAVETTLEEEAEDVKDKVALIREAREITNARAALLKLKDAVSVETAASAAQGATEKLVVEHLSKVVQTKASDAAEYARLAALKIIKLESLVK